MATCQTCGGSTVVACECVLAAEEAAELPHRLEAVESALRDLLGAMPRCEHWECDRIAVGKYPDLECDQHLCWEHLIAGDVPQWGDEVERAMETIGYE